MNNDDFVKSSLYQALRVAAIYVVIASLWIIFSDRILDYFVVDNHHLFLILQTVKGWFFVLVTGMFLFAERKINHERFFRSKDKYDTFINQSAEGMVMTDQNGCIVVWNSAMVQMTGISMPEIRGKWISDIPASIWNIEQHCISRPVLEEMLKSGSPALINCDDVTINRGDEKRCFELMLFVISAGDGYSLGAVIHDVTERRKTEEQLVASVNEKNVLLKEIHHRVKNNLQVIISLLRMQEKVISDGKELAAFRDSQSRIRAIAMIHEGLYQSGDLSRIHFSDYLHRLVADLPLYFNMKRDSVHFTINCGDIRFPIDKAVPLALLLSEVIADILRRTVPSDAGRELTVAVQRKERNIFVAVSDSMTDVKFDGNAEASFSIDIIKNLSLQLGGIPLFSPGDGVVFSLSFPENDHGKAE